MKWLIYVELKSGYSDDGPAWIGIVEFSRTGERHNLGLQFRIMKDASNVIA